MAGDRLAVLDRLGAVSELPIYVAAVPGMWAPPSTSVFCCETKPLMQGRQLLNYFWCPECKKIYHHAAIIIDGR